MVGMTRELPDQGYALEVDGRMKAEFATRDGARAGGQELKKRFPKGFRVVKPYLRITPQPNLP